MDMLCRLLGHSRSARTARYDYGNQRWRSTCRLCGGEMERDVEGRWALAEQDQASAATRS